MKMDELATFKENDKLIVSRTAIILKSMVTYNKIVPEGRGMVKEKNNVCLIFP